MRLLRTGYLADLRIRNLVELQVRILADLQPGIVALLVQILRTLLALPPVHPYSGLARIVGMAELVETVDIVRLLAD